MKSKGINIKHSAILSKYGFETWNVVRESIKSLYAVEESGENVSA